VGSFNFNLRSTYLNTESLLVIEDPELAKRLAADINQAMNQDNSWRLELQNGNVQWYSGSESFDHEPDTGKWQRFESYFLQLLPIEKYL
jgi:putative cardiolipin synthase